MSEVLGKMAEKLIAGDIDGVVDLTKEALNGGIAPPDVLENGLLAGMDVVGQRFKANDMFIPEVLRCARAMHGAMAILRPLLSESDAIRPGKLVVGTVKGDLHDIGKNLVVMMLKGSGFEVDDLGVDCRMEHFQEAAERGAQVICLSALLSTTRDEMRPVAEYFSENTDIKIVVGGAVITQEFADDIGADAFGIDASDAVRAVRASLNLEAAAA